MVVRGYLPTQSLRTGLRHRHSAPLAGQDCGVCQAVSREGATLTGSRAFARHPGYIALSNAISATVMLKVEDNVRRCMEQGDHFMWRLPKPEAQRCATLFSWRIFSHRRRSSSLRCDPKSDNGFKAQGIGACECCRDLRQSQWVSGSGYRLR